MNHHHRHQQQYHHHHRQQQHHPRQEQAAPTGDDGELSVKSTESASEEDGEQHITMAADDDRSSSILPHVLFAFLCLACIGLTIGLAASSGSQAADQPGETFDLRFNQYATQVEQVLQNNLDTIMDRFLALGERVTEQVNGEAVTSWPFVTISHVEAQSDSLQEQIGIGQISFHPIVYRDQRVNWERYVTQQFGTWMGESYSYRGSDKRPQLVSSFINHGFFAVEEATEPVDIEGYSGEPFYLPYWQVAPLIDHESLVLFDALKFEFVQTVIAGLLTQQQSFSGRNQPAPQPVLTHAINLQPLIGDQPESLLAVPVFKDRDADNSAVVGVFLISMPWEVFFENLLPVESIQFVTSAIDCGGDSEIPPTTYQVDKDGTVTFVGSEDATTIGNFEGIPMKLDISFMWTGTCQPEFTLYPTAAYEQEFLSVAESTPSIMPIAILGAALLLVLTGAYFVIRRRNTDNRSPRKRRRRRPTSNRSSSDVEQPNTSTQPTPPRQTTNQAATSGDTARNPRSRSGSFDRDDLHIQSGGMDKNDYRGRSGSFDSDQPLAGGLYRGRSGSFDSDEPLAGGHTSRPPRASGPRPSSANQTGQFESNRVLPNPVLDDEDEEVSMLSGSQVSTVGSLHSFNVPMNDEYDPGRPTSMRSFRAPQQQNQWQDNPRKPQSFSSLMNTSSSGLQLPPTPTNPGQRKRPTSSSSFRGMQPGAIRVDGSGALSHSNSNSPVTVLHDSSASGMSLDPHQMRSSSPSGNYSNNNLMRSNSPHGNHNPMRSSSPMRSNNAVARSMSTPLQPNNARQPDNLAAAVARREQQLREKTAISSSPARAAPSRSRSFGGTSGRQTDLAAIVAQREQQLKNKTANNTPTSRVATPGLRRTRASTRRQLQLQDISRHSNSGALAQQQGAEVIKDSTPEVFDKPIADNFPNCTIMFADLVGFTSWSAARQPTAVFNLLESLFNAFDKLAKQRGVFKVVTIGDCYVAATGVPKARKDHAVAMARFAKECMITMKKIFSKMQNMGEDTSWLGMRFGMSSGPVTGGIVRGEKSQFQLFGDTMNAASKIESMGEKDKIHIAETTALHIIESGREKWLEPRDEQLCIDGKSLSQTYWVSFGIDSRNQRMGASAGHLSFTPDDFEDLDLSDDELEDFEYDKTDIDNELIAQLMKDVGNERSLGNKPLASKYPSCTIFFGEVDGFIPWSAEKEPYQVFMLLEALFKAFDKIAKRRNIFKVETIADCYVASAGAPYRRDDHALAMAVFAHECLLASGHVVSELAETLGEGSKNLGMRFGLHSGPVMAGVLRGEKCRFQFFGDTMNTASRMESNGVKGKIQMSEATADLIRESGKGKWLVPREEKVKAKGKGLMQTYFLDANVKTSNPTAGGHVYSQSYGHLGLSSDDDSDDFADDQADMIQSRKEEKMYGMIDATVDILERLLKKIVAKRGNVEPSGPEPEFKRKKDGHVVDEMSDLIQLPSEATQFKISPAAVFLKEPVIKQLRDFVSVIAFMYSDVSFHSFEHANFVIESANRILSRTVAPQTMEFIGMTEDDRIAAKNMKDYSNMIRSDPLTQFTMVFAALIHGLQHPGVPEEEISSQCTDLAIMYNNRCIVEQNALETSWDMFMEPQFADLRSCIYRTEDELQQFRKLLVNCVVGSNLFDSGLKFGRNRRWKKAFVSAENSSSSFDFSMSSLDSGDDVNLKATVAIEHIMQGAIWSHTMQRFEVFVKWNEKMFHETVDAFKKGSIARDPTGNWFYLQLRFLDSYAIPLASRLVETELFGFNGEEYLRNAKRNRQEWELKGRDLVGTFLLNRGTGER